MNATSTCSGVNLAPARRSDRTAIVCWYETNMRWVERICILKSARPGPFVLEAKVGSGLPATPEDRGRHRLPESS